MPILGARLRRRILAGMNDGGERGNWVRLAALGMIWGGAFPLVEVALTGAGPIWVAAARLALAALLLLPLAAIRGLLPRGARLWAFAGGVALFSNALPFSLLSWGQTHVTGGVAGVSMAVMPLVALPMAHLLVPGERMSLRGVAGLGIGFAGVLVLIGPGALAELGGGGVEVLAQLACLSATVCYVTGSILIKRAGNPEPVGFAAAAMGLAAAMIVPAAFALEGAPGWPGTGPALAILALAAGPTTLALFVMLRILSSAGPAFLSLVNYQVPVWATVFGAAFLGETVSPSLGIALALILLGVAVANGLVGRRPQAA